jgi:hypothetical protein
MVSALPDMLINLGEHLQVLVPHQLSYRHRVDTTDNGVGRKGVSNCIWRDMEIDFVSKPLAAIDQGHLCPRAIPVIPENGTLGVLLTQPVRDLEGRVVQ